MCSCVNDGYQCKCKANVSSFEVGKTYEVVRTKRRFRVVDKSRKDILTVTVIYSDAPNYGSEGVCCLRDDGLVYGDTCIEYKAPVVHKRLVVWQKDNHTGKVLMSYAAHGATPVAYHDYKIVKTEIVTYTEES